MNLTDVKKHNYCAATTAAVIAAFPGFEINKNSYSINSPNHVLRIASGDTQIEMWFIDNLRHYGCDFYFVVTRIRGYNITIAHDVYGNPRSQIPFNSGVTDILVRGCPPEDKIYRRIDFFFESDAYDLANFDSSNVLRLYRSLANIVLAQPNYRCDDLQYINAVIDWRGDIS